MMCEPAFTQCHIFFNPISPLPPSDNEQSLKAVKMRVLPRGWVFRHGVERVCAFIVCMHADLNEIEKCSAEGWEYVATLPNKKVMMKNQAEIMHAWHTDLSQSR